MDRPAPIGEYTGMFSRGASPVEPEVPGRVVAPAHLQAPQPIGAELPVAPAAPPVERRSFGAGVALLVAAAGAGAGAVFGGAWGAGAGALLAGAGTNSLRAARLWKSPEPAARAEAAKNATVALFGALLGGYLAYRAYRSKQPERHADIAIVPARED